jgi:hypothetical protein
MASGSFNINTFSWYNELPLSNDGTAYSTCTMFAVGPSSFMQPYSFYQYTSTSGFVDTSTLTTILNSSLTSTTNFIGKIYMSTIPYTAWIDTTSSASYIQTYPFTYPSTFPCTFSTFLSTIPTLPPFISTIPSTCTTNPSGFGLYPSSLNASNFFFDFTSSFSGSNFDSPISIVSSNLYLGPALQRVINSKQYNVFIDCHYSIYTKFASTSISTMFMSTIGLFGQPFTNNSGRTSCTRIGNNQCMDIINRFAYKPQLVNENPKEIGQNASNYNLTMIVQAMNTRSMITTYSTISTLRSAFDIFIPGQNNFTFTLIPVLSTVTN